MSKYGSWKLAALQDELRRRRVKCGGRKVELVERLQHLDQVTDYQTQRFPSEVAQASVAIPTPDIEQDLVWGPPQSSYVSLNAESVQLHQVPMITRYQIEHYIVCRQVLGRIQNGDSSAMKNGSRMLDDCVEAMSLYSNETTIFFIGVVSAEMRTKLSYSVKFMLSKLSGEPLQSSCECPVGQGPNATCKHVVALLLVLACYFEGGDLKIKVSCTETLQSFHKPKKQHQGGLVECESLGQGIGPFDVDPRQDCDKKNCHFITSRIQMATVAYCLTSGEDLAMRYTFGRADIQAAALDHDYLEENFLNH